MKIDGDRLLTWLDEQEAGLRAARAEHAEGSPAYHSLGGGLTVISIVRTNLPSLAAGRKPVSESHTPTKAKVRHRDPATSLQAALSQTPDKTRMLYTTIYAILERSARTDEELLDIFQQAGKAVTPSGVRSRRAELTEAGWVRDSGERRDTKAGHPSIVWEAVPSVI